MAFGPAISQQVLTSKTYIMSFQILNKEGEALTMKELDAEACAFWKKDSHPKHYADPSEPRREGESEVNFLRRSMTSNWFDIIGWCIHSQGNACGGWPNVVATMIAESIGMHFIDTSDGYKDRPIKLPEWQLHEYKNKEGEDKKTYHLPDKVEESIFGIYQFYQPYIDLINHWQGKGYQPLKVNE